MWNWSSVLRLPNPWIVSRPAAEFRLFQKIRLLGGRRNRRIRNTLLAQTEKIRQPTQPAIEQEFGWRILLIFIVFSRITPWILAASRLTQTPNLKFCFQNMTKPQILLPKRLNCNVFTDLFKKSNFFTDPWIVSRPGTQNGRSISHGLIVTHGVFSRVLSS